MRVILVATLAAGFVLAGCFDSAALGPCTLRVSVVDLFSGRSTAVEPPYRVVVATPSRPSGLSLAGEGWTQMNVELRHPSGAVTNDQFSRQQVRLGDLSFVQFTSPGQSHVRLSDPVSGCVREFGVEAVNDEAANV